ncbi:unnamed protein product [Phytophthora fragariaefolia]|uniref:Unnamed protein product n=1 Tax=Phytophthora fragariaefolia TaxID=1490495 RepID=A0A9W7D0I1_9STRA|nr:unnamed protein product [Phytophthora fragariaefolia]
MTRWCISNPSIRAFNLSIVLTSCCITLVIAMTSVLAAPPGLLTIVVAVVAGTCAAWTSAVVDSSCTGSPSFAGSSEGATAAALGVDDFARVLRVGGAFIVDSISTATCLVVDLD